MKTLYSTVLIAVLVIGFLVAASPGKAEAWHRSSVSFSVVLPPFGVSIGSPYYYPGPVYAVPPYPVYSPYYGAYFYGPHFRHRHFGHRVWRGDWHDRGRWRD